MFRIIKAEIRKTFAKPGIFILTAILICVLFASALLYTPTVRDQKLVAIDESLDKQHPETVSVSAMYNDYYMSDSNTTASFDYNTKLGFDNEIANITKTINFYYYTYYSETEYGSTIDGTIYDSIIKVSNLYSDFENIKVCLNDYQGKCTGTNTDRETSRNNLKTAITKMQLDLVQIAKPQSTIIALVNEGVRKELNDDVLVKAYNYLNIGKNGNSSTDKAAFDNILAMNFTEKIKTALDSFEEFKPSQEVLDKALEYVEEVKVRSADFNAQIEEYATNNGSSKEATNRKEFNLLVTKNKLTISECKDIVELSIHYDALKGFSANQITKYSATKDVNIYELQENLTKNEYMFKNKSLALDYATPLSITQTSNDYANAFDFSYFALRLCLFIIIIYTVVLAASSIAGEQQAGTFKLLAIRPFSRNKLFMGKMLSTILMGFILLFISVIATFIAGVIKFGTVASLPVLIVFNAHSAFTMPVFGEYLIAILTMCYEIVFFVIMAYAISTIFKSNVGAVAVSIFIYFASLILNTIAPSATVLRFLPFTNINLFKYFGSSFLSTQASSFLFSVLTPTVILGSTFVFSLLMSGLFALLILGISLIVFNKRDLR